MTQNSPVLRSVRSILDVYTYGVRILVYVLVVFAGLGILAMMAVTCIDVVLRLFRSALDGALEIVKILSALTIACALPYTTAVKGHVAIEYFFLKFNRTGKILIDTIQRLAAIVFFSLLAWQCVVYGKMLKAAGQVTATLQIPVFWVPYIIAFSCGVVVLVIIYNLLHPGKEMIKP